MYYLLGTIAVFVIAYILIKLTVKENPDSQLGIMDHPSAFKKQDIEMVDKRLGEDEKPIK